MQHLNAPVVNPPTGTRLRRAMAINKWGKIAGYTASGVFKLTTLVEPPSFMFLLD